MKYQSTPTLRCQLMGRTAGPTWAEVAPSACHIGMLAGTASDRVSDHVPAVRWQWRAVRPAGAGTQACNPARPAEGWRSAAGDARAGRGVGAVAQHRAHGLRDAVRRAVGGGQGRLRHLRVGLDGVGRQAADQGAGAGPDTLRRPPAGLAGADAAQRRASPALRPALRRALGRSAAGHRMAARAGTRGERRRVGLPAKRRPACAASGHQRIPRAAARRRVPRRRRGRRQRDAAGGLAARPRADRRRVGRRDRRSRLRTRVARVAGAWRAPAAGQGRRRGFAGRGAAAWEAASAWSRSRRRTSFRPAP